MGQTIVCILIAIVLVTFVALFVRADMRSERWQKEWRAGHEFGVHLAKVAESDDRTALAGEFATKPWREVRAICETLHGTPCECATKAAAADKVWWTLARRQNRRSGQPVIRDYEPARPTTENAQGAPRNA